LLALVARLVASLDLRLLTIQIGARRSNFPGCFDSQANGGSSRGPNTTIDRAFEYLETCL
jgi:hypothetical protein